MVSVKEDNFMTQTISNYDLTAYNYQMFAPGGVDEKKVEALAEDMKKNGFTSVILLANLDGWYLVTGTHRYLAAKKLDEEDIEVEIKYVEARNMRSLRVSAKSGKPVAIRQQKGD
jgi:ParB-like chromosome segregation protein Spo0J